MQPIDILFITNSNSEALKIGCNKDSNKTLFYFQIVVDDYAQSFRDVLAFEKSNQKDPAVRKAFSEAVHKVRERHTNTVIIMAEAVMEMKANAQRHGQINGAKQPRYYGLWNT